MDTIKAIVIQIKKIINYFSKIIIIFIIINSSDNEYEQTYKTYYSNSDQDYNNKLKVYFLL